MDNKGLAKQFLRFRQVEQINKLAEEQVAEDKAELDLVGPVEQVEEVDENTMRLDQLMI